MKVQTAESPLLRPRNDDNRKRVVWIVVLLLISVECPEIPTYCTYLWPSIKIDKVNWFLHYDMKMPIWWYLKFTCERVGWILRMIAFTKTAVQYSVTIFLASFLILCYIIIDLILFWWNYNTSVYGYEFLILFLYITMRGLIKPYSPDSFARIRSIF